MKGLIYMANDIMSFDDFNEKKNEELKKKQKEKGEIKGFDFDNPTSIMYYGEDVLQIFENLRQNVPVTFSDEGYKDYEFTEPLENINEFNKGLEGKSDDKEWIKKNKLASGVARALNKISRGHIDVLGVNEDFARSYTEYLDNVRQIGEQVKKDQINLIKDVRFFISLRKFVNYLIENLDKIIKDGEDSIKRQELEIKTNPYLDIDNAKFYLDIAAERIVALKTARGIMYGLCGQIDLKNATASKLSNQYSNYLQVIAPTVNIYASIAVGVKRDAAKIDRLLEVQKAVNETLVGTSRKLNDNVEKVVTLDDEGMITMPTIEELMTQFQTGVDLIATSQKEREANRQNVLDTLDRFEKTISEGEKTLRRAMMGNENFEDKPKNKGYSRTIKPWKK